MRNKNTQFFDYLLAVLFITVAFLAIRIYLFHYTHPGEPLFSMEERSYFNYELAEAIGELDDISRQYAIDQHALQMQYLDFDDERVIDDDKALPIAVFLSRFYAGNQSICHNNLSIIGNTDILNCGVYKHIVDNFPKAKMTGHFLFVPFEQLTGEEVNYYHGQTDYSLFSRHNLYLMNLNNEYASLEFCKGHPTACRYVYRYR